MTTLQELENEHEKQAAAICKKQLSNEHYQVNPNDVWWMYLEPQVEKQLGRSSRVYNRLIRLQK